MENKGSRYPSIQVSRYSCIQVNRYPGIQVSRYPGIQVSRYPGICLTHLHTGEALPAVPVVSPHSIDQALVGSLGDQVMKDPGCN